MAENSRPVAEPLQKGAQAAQMVKGAVKTGKAIAGAAKGVAAGGVWGAVVGFAWENRKFLGKVIIAATAVLMIGSRCFSGLRVNLPAFFAVGSPSL